LAGAVVGLMRTLIGALLMLGGLSYMLSKALRYHEHVDMPTFRKRWERLPHVETGTRKRF
jgi:hypothetical protein